MWRNRKRYLVMDDDYYREGYPYNDSDVGGYGPGSHYWHAMNKDD
jgi:hypothetical protein